MNEKRIKKDNSQKERSSQKTQISILLLIGALNCQTWTTQQSQGLCVRRNCHWILAFEKSRGKRYSRVRACLLALQTFPASKSFMHVLPPVLLDRKSPRPKNFLVKRAYLTYVESRLVGTLQIRQRRTCHSTKRQLR